MAPIKDDVIRCQLPARAQRSLRLGRRVREFFENKKQTRLSILVLLLPTKS